MTKPITTADLRRYAVARTLFAPTTLAKAITRLGFVQADPIRAPARAQDAGNVASTLSSLQRGVSRGREESGGWVPNRPSDPEGSNS